VLRSLSCEKCEAKGRRHRGVVCLARMRERLEVTGAGKAACVEVDLPAALGDGSRAVMCEACRQASESWALELTLRNFTPRPSILPSRFVRSADFHLECSSSTCGRCLSVSKVGDNKYGLEFRGPLGMIQAFVASLLVLR